MSYELMVFQPKVAPPSHQECRDWYIDQIQSDEGHSYRNPAVTSSNLRAGYVAIIQQFPPMNGTLATENLPEDEASASDQSIGKQIIYVCFA
jgi:hypothetical protein